ncbi:hypothetical protein B0H13DRAFT_1524774, partial [Mycena leptocephala]
YSQRSKSGAYDSIADQIEAMGQEALANLDYPDTITRHIEDWSKNHKYLGQDGNELRVSVVGEILGPAQGTIIRANGNFYARPGDKVSPSPIDDKTKVKDTIALGIPTCATVKMYNTVLNQIICATQITAANADEDKRKGLVRVVLSLLPVTDEPSFRILFSTTAMTLKMLQSRRKKRKWRFLAVSCQPTPFNGVIHSVLHLADEIQLGAFYEPSLLPDFGGDYFNLVKNKLVQHDIRDVHSNLVPPWKIYEALRPGTLVLVLVTLHCFVMKDDSSKEPRERKVYQMNAESIRILAESDEDVEPRTRPIAPTAGDRVTASLPARATA